MKVGQLLIREITEPHTEVITFNNNEPGDIVTEDLYFETNAPCNVVAKGYGLKNMEGVNLKFVDVANYSIKDTVEDAGTYMIMVTAYEKVELSFTPSNGPVKAIIRTVYGG